MPRRSSRSTTSRNIVEAFADSGYDGDDANGMAEAIAKMLNAPALKAGTVLRVGLEVRGDAAKVVRTSVYDRTNHLVTIALDDRKQYVPAAEPEPNPEIADRFRRFAAGGACAAICRRL